MPMAWEIPPNVIVGILHTETVPIAWSFGLRNLIIPGQYPPVPVAGQPFDMARNTIVHTALAVNADAVFMFDSDIVPPRDIILRLLASNQPIISGLYSRRSPPWSVPVARRNNDWLKDYTPGEIVEVDVVGTGCLLIRTDVFRHLAQYPQDARRGKIWFDWKCDMPGLPPGESTSEDFSFCLHARRFGYKVLVDTGIVCHHVGYGEATHGHYKPAEVRTVT